MTNPSLHIETFGNRDKPKIVFLHGFLGSGSDWLPIARELQNDYCCVLVDLPGHGSASIPNANVADASTFFMATVDALAEAIRNISPEPCILVGYSMGGRVALTLLLRYPMLFSKGVIVSASPGLRSEEDRAKRRESDESIARKIERNFDGFIAAWYDQPLFSTLKSHPIFHEVEAQRKVNNPPNLANALRLLGTGQQPSQWEALAHNQCPLHFFVGEKDERYVEIARQMVKLTPMSGMTIFPECGHTLQLENKALFIKQLRIFINT